MLVKTYREDYINLTKAHIICQEENGEFQVVIIPLRGNTECFIRSFRFRHDAQELIESIAKALNEGRKLYRP